MKKNWMSYVLAGVMAAGILTGCGSQAGTQDAAAGSGTTAAGTEAAASQEAAGGDKVTIELFHQKPENVELYNTLVAKFMEENPDIQVNVTLAETTNTTLISRAAAGNMPQLTSVFAYASTYRGMMSEGLFRDLSDEEFLQKVNPAVLERCKVDGKSYSLPLTVNAYGLFYNEDIFNELNLQVPTTEAELWDVCETLKENGIQAFSFPDKKTTRVSQLFENTLIGTIDHDFVEKCKELKEGTYKITEDEKLRHFAENIIKIHEYANPDSLGYDDEPAYEEFTSGKCAMYIDGTWAVTTFETLNPELNFKMVPIPAEKAEDSWTASAVDTAYAISSDCSEEQYQACLKFLNFLVRDDVAQEFCDMDKNPNLISGVEYKVPQVEVMNQYIEEGKFEPVLAAIWTQDLRNALQVSVQALIMDKDVDTFLNDFQNTIEEYYTE